MLKKLKRCKNLKEIYDTIPEEYYEKGSLFIIFLMLFMIVAETTVRYITRHAALNEMIQYFYFAGYTAVVFAVAVLTIKIAGVGVKGIKEYLKRKPYDITLIIMLLWAFVSAVCSDYIRTAFLGNWFRQSGFRTYLIYASLYICGKNIKQQKTRLRIYLAFGVVSTLQNMLLITHSLGYYGCKTGAFYNTNHSGYFIAMSVFAIIALISEDKRLYMKAAGVAMYVVNVWCLIINNTFGAYIAVLLGLVFLVIISLIKNKKVNRMVLLSVLLFIAVSAYTDSKTNIISVNFGVTGNDIIKIAEGSEDADRAGTGRWELWVNAVKYIKKEPLFGSGPDCLTEIEKRVVDKEAQEGILSEPHNEYLQYAAEIGIFPALCYIASLIMIVVFRLRELKKTEDSLIYKGAVVFVYCVSAFFGVIFFYTAVYFFFFLGMSSKRHA